MMNTATTTLHFTTLDYVLIGIMLISIIISFFRGFLKEAISLAIWFFAFFGALKFSPIVDLWLRSLITHAIARYAVSVGTIFIGVLLLGAIIGRIAQALVKTSGLGFVDKLLGGIFGAARGVLFAMIILLVITASPYATTLWFSQSAVAATLKEPVAHFSTLLPKNIQNASTWIERFDKYRHPMAS